MRVVDLERPAAPLEYLALYLLKHQDMVKLPPKVLSKKPDLEDEDRVQVSSASRGYSFRDSGGELLWDSNEDGGRHGLHCRKLTHAAHSIHTS